MNTAIKLLHFSWAAYSRPSWTYSWSVLTTQTSTFWRWWSHFNLREWPFKYLFQFIFDRSELHNTLSLASLSPGISYVFYFYYVVKIPIWRWSVKKLQIRIGEIDLIQITFFDCLLLLGFSLDLILFHYQFLHEISHSISFVKVALGD